MREKLLQQHGAARAPQSLSAESPSAGRLRRGRLADHLIGVARSTAADLDERGTHIAIALAASIAALAILGALNAATGSPPAFDLDGELNLNRGLISGMDYPALFSGALLFAAAVLALEASAVSERFPWAPLGAFLAFMGTDELMTIHETLERSIGMDWQILYLPIVAALGPFWLIALGRMWEFHSERLLWLGGAVAWLVAQMLEFVVWHASALSGLSGGITLVEEILEMAGSAMFLLALYLASRRLARGRASLGRHHARA